MPTTNEYRFLLFFSMLLAIIVMLAMVRAGAQEPDGVFNQPRFKHIKPSEFVGNKFTHVETNGIVRYVRAESDGDVHVMVCETASADGTPRNWMKGCVLAECIPAVPMGCKTLKHGDVVSIWGISRYDRWHRWNEIHPVLGFSALR